MYFLGVFLTIATVLGWIPERILFPKNPNKVRDHETPPERAWERLMSAHAYGDCLITMSSSEKGVTDQRADELGLITGHAYAVLNVMETRNGTRLLQLKNPWAHKVWYFSTKSTSFCFVNSA